MQLLLTMLLEVFSLLTLGPPMVRNLVLSNRLRWYFVSNTHFRHRGADGKRALTNNTNINVTAINIAPECFAVDSSLLAA